MNRVNEAKLITFGDLFCGGGGTTTGALMVPEVRVVWAVGELMELGEYVPNMPNKSNIIRAGSSGYAED